MIALSKILSLSLLFFGVFILMQVVLPIISFGVWEQASKLNSKTLVSPHTQVLGVSVENKDNFSYFVSNIKRNLPYTQFRITIPKLNIEKTDVLVESNDLSSGLVHLPGTALPGERGNVFISGHSALSPIIKKAAFAKLSDLKKGDQIEVEAMGTKFTYQVTELKIISPSDVSVINPPDPLGRFISLMTCVPPGLNLKRLVVLGKMI